MIPMRSSAIAVVLSLGAAVSSLLLSPVIFAAHLESHFPGASWDRKAPATLDLDADVLDQIAAYLGGRGCIVRHGYMAYEWGDCAKRGDVASSAKPWFSTFLLLAVREGLLDSVNTPVSTYIPELASSKNAAITFAHMANQVSCYGVQEAPGTAFDYNDFQMALFIDTLFGKVYGVPMDRVDAEVLRPRLASILRFEDDPTFLAFGMGDRPGRLAVSPRDFARFGWLFLNRGQWKGRQVLPEADVLMATRSPLPNSIPQTNAVEAPMLHGQRTLGSGTIPDNQTDHFGSYSWAWWLNGVDREGNRMWSDAPLDTFTALGHANGQRGIAVIPSMDVVISWNDTTLGDRPDKPHPLNEVFRLLMLAAKDAPMPGQVMVDPAQPAWMARNSDTDKDGRPDPFIICGPGDPEGFLYLGERRDDGTRDGAQETIINRIAKSGANAIYMIAIRSHGGDGGPMENPFINADPKQGLDEDILQQWEQWFTRMDEAGIVSYLFVYDDSASIWNTGDEVGDAEKAFLTTLVNRFEHHQSLIWCVAEEYQERLTPARVSAIARIIRETDEHQHIIAVHKLEGLDFSEFADDPNIDQFAIQYNKPEADQLHAGLVSAWRDALGRYNLNFAETADHGFGAEARRKNWAAALAGASAMPLGWTFADSEHPSDADLAACGYLVRFMESKDYRDMAPNDELATGGTTYLMAKPGEGYIAYLANTTGGLGLRDMTKGAYNITWLNPASGEKIEQIDIAIAQGDLHLDAPAAMTDDVVAYVRRVMAE